MRTLITITEKDIEDGRRCSGRRCPVALAMRRAGIRNPQAGTLELSSYDFHKNQSTYWKTPIFTAAFISAFDERRTQECQPFKFQLPEESTCVSA